jgi:cell division protein FtsW
MSAAIAALRSGIRLPGAGARHARGSHRVEHSLMLTATMCLVAFGVVMIFSASSTASLLGESGDSAYFLKRTLMFGVVGLIAFRLAAGASLALVRRLTPLMLAGSFALLLLVLVPGMAAEANGAGRWLAAGPIQIQPSELAKIALLLYGAHLIALRPGMTADLRSLRPYLLICAAVCVLIVVEPDLGTAMVCAFSAGALLIAAGAKLRHLALLAAGLAAMALLMVVIEPYRAERITSFLNPGADAEGAGFQVSQATIAIGSGGVFGTGLGESVQKAFYLPEAHTDMIAAVIGEEMGLLGITVLVCLYALLCYAGFRTAQQARDRYGRLLVAGLTAMIMIQATINLYAVMGMAPLTGVPLPLVSYGNTSLIVTLAAVGLMLNVAGGGTAGSGFAERAEPRRRPRRPSARSRPAQRSSGAARAARGDRGRRHSGTRGSRARRRRRA